ncbi:unnamed protein product [Polarella glacialis]|uniref:Uncharacterized protein n=1 Tax=Polarella glacialis TaxID=89957 RepID=A0A813JMY4_POLGL|nr:unnamed protein product [Polarella glacialis]
MPPAGHRRRRPATFVALAAAATGLGITAPAALFRSRSDAAADASSSSKQTHIYSDQAPRRRARTHSELDQIGGNLFYATSAELEETSPRRELTESPALVTGRRSGRRQQRSALRLWPWPEAAEEEVEE